jgi:hypothetical protein
VADWVSDQWDAWRSIPHARLWRDADWQFALDTIELAAQAFQDGAKVGLFTQLRYREKVLGTTWSARQDMRIRYIEPSSSAPAIVDAAADSHQDSTPHPCVKGNLMGRMVLRAHRDRSSRWCCSPLHFGTAPSTMAGQCKLFTQPARANVLLILWFWLRREDVGPSGRPRPRLELAAAQADLDATCRGRRYWGRRSPWAVGPR